MCLIAIMSKYGDVSNCPESGVIGHLKLASDVTWKSSIHYYFSVVFDSNFSHYFYCLFTIIIATHTFVLVLFGNNIKIIGMQSQICTLWVIANARFSTCGFEPQKAQNLRHRREEKASGGKAISNRGPQTCLWFPLGILKN